MVQDPSSPREDFLFPFIFAKDLDCKLSCVGCRHFFSCCVWDSNGSCSLPDGGSLEL